MEKEKIIIRNELITDFEKETMLFMGHIKSHIAEKFASDIKIFEEKKTELITLRFACFGGLNEPIQDHMNDIFRNSKIWFEGYNSGFAYSAAALIIQFCHWRSAAPNRKMMIHWPVPIDQDGNTTSSEPISKEHEEWWYDIFAARSGKSISFIKSIAHLKLPAEECLKYNLIDQITEKPMRPKIKITP